MRRGRLARGVAAVALALAVPALAGCSGDGNSVASQAQAGDGKGYVAGDGTVEQIAAADRRTTISVKGTTLEGEPLDTSSARGKVVVLNTWGSWCPPCNAEAPGLQRTWAGFEGQDVQFVGIDVREGKDAGLAFQRKLDITYPSLEWDGGGVLLQLQGKASATPTTLVLDRQGRLAGRISGEAKGSTLRDMVQDVLDESS
ncbi:TlpA disulfide reductase family protein [Angustibacter peucedani]